MKSSTIFRGLAGVAAGMLFALGGQAAHAETLQMNQQDFSELVDLYNTHGVDPAITDSVIAGIRVGDLPDSITQSIPVDSSTQSTTEGIVTVNTFADGSILVSTIETGSPAPLVEPGTVGTYAIEGCTDYSSGGYVSKQNCYISNTVGLFTISFRADYSYWGSGSAISGAQYPNLKSSYGSATPVTLNRTAHSASGSGAASVTAHTVFTNWANRYSEDIYLSLRVYTTYATTTSY